LPAPVEGAPADPWVPGSVYERLLAAETRREQGAWFTPPGLAASLVRFTLEGRGGGAPRSVCDPAMGAGAFLLAAAEELVARGGSRHEAALALHGADIDPDAVAVARASVRIWAGGPVEGIDRRLVVGDTLA